MVELLAPSGSMQALEAAIAAGANAVYLGMQQFGARASATNFNYEELLIARRKTALHGVKMYITLNTLVKQHEINDLLHCLKQLQTIAPDAVIVQDIGVAHLVKQVLPNMPLHASTQLAIHTPSGARFLQRHGFTRVVLARECSLSTIQEVVKTGIEVEVFVHGALCVSMSGQCLLSSFNGGRSGNRGRCAQPCRQPLSFNNERATWLSTRDIMLYNFLPQLISAGVHSLKIEGRLKSPTYVANVVQTYQQGIQTYANNEFKKLSKQAYFSLLQTFNRGDFSEGYVSQNEDFKIINKERSNNHGVCIGEVTKVDNSLLHFKVNDTIQNGDMLRIVKGTQENDFELIYSGKETLKGGIATTFLRDAKGIAKGQQVYRLISVAQTQFAESLPTPKLQIQVDVHLCQHQEAKIIISASNFSQTYTLDVCSPATNAPLTESRIQEVFQKISDYPLSIQHISIHTDGVFLPISKLNLYRRTAYEQFLNAYINSKISSQPWVDYTPELHHYQSTVGNIVLSSEFELAKHINQTQTFVYAPQDNRLETLEKTIACLPKSAYILLHTNMDDDTANAVINLASKHQLQGVVVDNIGQLGLDFKQLNVALGEHVPLCNHLALQALLPYNPKFILAFPELTYDEVCQVSENIAQKSYGLDRMMILNHCPARTALELSEQKEHCTMCHTGNPNALMHKTFTDHKNDVFPLYPIFTNHKCFVYMLNKTPTNRTSQWSKLKFHPSFCELVEPLQEQIHLLSQLSSFQVVEGGTLGHFSDAVL